MIILLQMSPPTVSVVVVEHGHAGLGVAVQLGLLPVVGLRHPEPARVRPRVEAVRGVGGRHRNLVRGS